MLTKKADLLCWVVYFFLLFYLFGCCVVVWSQSAYRNLFIYLLFLAEAKSIDVFVWTLKRLLGLFFFYILLLDACVFLLHVMKTKVTHHAHLSCSIQATLRCVSRLVDRCSCFITDYDVGFRVDWMWMVVFIRLLRRTSHPGVCG